MIMDPQTFAEKIFKAPAGAIVFARPDIILTHDNTSSIYKTFQKMGGKYCCMIPIRCWLYSIIMHRLLMQNLQHNTRRSGILSAKSRDKEIL